MSRFGSVLQLLLPSSTVRREIIKTELSGTEEWDSFSKEEWDSIIQATEGKDGRWLSRTLCGEAKRAVAREAGIGGNVRAITFADFETILSAASTASTSLCLHDSQASSSADAAPSCSDDKNHVRSHLELSPHKLEQKPLPGRGIAWLRFSASSVARKTVRASSATMYTRTLLKGRRMCGGLAARRISARRLSGSRRGLARLM